MKYYLIIKKGRKTKKIVFDKDDLDRMREKYPDKVKDDNDYFHVVLRTKEEGVFEIKRIPKVDITEIEKYTREEKGRSIVNALTDY